MKKTIFVLMLIALILVPTFAKAKQRDNIVSLTVGPNWQMSTTTDDEGNTTVDDGKRLGVEIEASGAFFFTAKLPVAVSASVNFNLPLKYSTSEGTQDISDNPTITTFKTGLVYAYDLDNDLSVYASADLGFSLQKWSTTVLNTTITTSTSKLSLGFGVKGEYRLEDFNFIGGLDMRLPLSYQTRVKSGNTSFDSDEYNIKGFEITVPVGISINF